MGLSLPASLAQAHGPSIVSPEQKLGDIKSWLLHWGLIFGTRKGASGLLIRISGSSTSQAHNKGMKEGPLALRSPFRWRLGTLLTFLPHWFSFDLTISAIPHLHRSSSGWENTGPFCFHTLKMWGRGEEEECASFCLHRKRPPPLTVGAAKPPSLDSNPLMRRRN